MSSEDENSGNSADSEAQSSCVNAVNASEWSDFTLLQDSEAVHKLQDEDKDIKSSFDLPHMWWFTWGWEALHPIRRLPFGRLAIRLQTKH